MTRPPRHHGRQREPANLPWKRDDANRDCHATLAMARLPNTPRPKWAVRIPDPATVRTEAVANRPPLIRAVATPRAEVTGRPAKLRPENERAAILEPPT